VVNGDIHYGQIFIHADARVNGQLTCLLEEAVSEVLNVALEPVVKKLKAV
jgi:cytoskeletal protein CcmA (bactofilin family)